MAATVRTFEGRCHCGAVGFVLRTSQEPAQWTVRACQCSFCRKHAVRTTTDPSGSVTFRNSDAGKLKRYRFGTRSTDFLVCGECGVYIAALLTSNRGQFATVNINTIAVPLNTPAPQPVSYDAESTEERQARRERGWTPVAGGV
jgi:hypothetical protein